MITALKFSTFTIICSLLIVGCGGSSKQEPATSGSASETSCDTNAAVTLNATTLHVMQNSISTSTKILNDMNATLGKEDAMNERVLETAELLASTVKKLAEKLQMTDEGAKFFQVNNSFPFFVIKKPLSKKYILASSANKFFPDTQTIKTLFYNSSTLTNALNRAVNGANKNNNLYMTILQVETNGTITNLTNGLFIPKSLL